jgi:hypothetical protein
MDSGFPHVTPIWRAFPRALDFLTCNPPQWLDRSSLNNPPFLVMYVIHDTYRLGPVGSGGLTGSGGGGGVADPGAPFFLAS